MMHTNKGVLMLNRNIDLSYYTEGDKSIKEMMDYFYTKSSNINQSFWTEADIDTRFKAGDQTLWNDYYGNLPAHRRKKFTFNRIRRVTNMITGHQRQNRKSTIAYPVEHDDDKASSQWSKLLFNTMKGANCDELISEAFEKGSITSGMSLLNTYIDYSKDPISGDIKVDHVPYNSFLIDPYFRKKDLSDCNFVWRRQWLTKDSIKGLVHEDVHEYIDSLQKGGGNDGRFQLMAQSYNYGVDNLLTFDEFLYKDTREAIFLVDESAGLTREWKGDDEQLEQFLGMYPQVNTMKTEVPTVKLAQCVNGETIYNGKNHLNIDRYPFIPFLGYYEPDLACFEWRVQGVVRGLRDSQFLYNRRKVIELDILESQINSGYKYKPTSLVNPKDVYMAGQGKGLALKQEADMNDVQEIMPAQVPPSMIQLSEMLGREIQEISGVNEELLGSANDDKAGILSMLRQGAGLTTLQVLFDQLDFSQKLLGETFLEIIQNNFTEGKIGRILNEEPVPEFKTKTFLNYDIRIEEGVNTATQRQMEFQQLLHLRELGLPIPTQSIVKAATLQNKDELIETIQAEEQQAQQEQQMQLQQQMAVLQAQVQDLEARATASYGMGLERMSRIQENSELSVERRAQAIENISDARLNRAKTLAELQNIDINRIQQLLDIANALKMNEEDGAIAAEGASEPVTQTGQKLSSLNVLPSNTL